RAVQAYTVFTLLPVRRARSGAVIMPSVRGTMPPPFEAQAPLDPGASPTRVGGCVCTLPACSGGRRGVLVRVRKGAVLVPAKGQRKSPLRELCPPVSPSGG